MSKSKVFVFWRTENRFGEKNICVWVGNLIFLILLFWFGGDLGGLRIVFIYGTRYHFIAFNCEWWNFIEALSVVDRERGRKIR